MNYINIICFIILLTICIIATFLILNKLFQNETKENFISFDDYMKNPNISFKKFKTKIDQLYLKKRKKGKKEKQDINYNENLIDNISLFFDTKKIPKGVSKNIESFEDYQKEKNIKEDKDDKIMEEIIHSPNKNKKYNLDLGPAYPYLQDNTLVPNEYYENNQDLEYEMKRKEGLVNTNNQMAPISEPSIGRKNKSTYDVPVISENTTRNPAPGSKKEAYIIPKPSLKPKFKAPGEILNYDLNPYDNKIQKAKYLLDKDIGSETLLEEQENSIHSSNIINKESSLLLGQPCKFIGSYKKKANCPAGFRNYTGASVGMQGSNLMCNNKKIKNSAAKAIPIVKNGQIQKIVITNSGNNYKNPPQITIFGEGRDAEAQAKLKNGKVVSIIVTNPGKGYSSSPIINIDGPDGYIYCHLCCKI